MRAILIALLIAGNAAGGWYFTGGRVAMGLGIVAASWIVFVIIDALVLKSSYATEETVVEPILPSEAPAERIVFANLEEQASAAGTTDRSHAASFPDIRDEDAATAEHHVTPAKDPVTGIPAKEKPDTQQCLF
ncbi:hypothetical protein [Noviherbaspirillum suwonense]|uniref:TM2 domain-containing protein n=1 Tax=Noviherbaspirillum suwonense TaxID=1224511 RepID=A0ABY1QU34_9BURK|nr:hypothetical protein [Noviherbaspirillum suwonense]SMP80101.1 hypothetical protein SAMN06295970_1343 [Noviherbaspirillum suwonense]